MLARYVSLVICTTDNKSAITNEFNMYNRAIAVGH